MASPTVQEAAMTERIDAPAAQRPDASEPAPAPIAVVTGGSQGLGEALVKGLVEAGWEVVTDARRADRLSAAAARLGPARVRVHAVAGDVAEPAHRARLVATASALGPVSLLVNNASTLGASPLPAADRLEPAVLRRLFDVNVIAPLALLTGLLPHLGPGAVILNVTSDAAVEAYEGWAGYGASKAALEQLGRVLALEHPELRVLSVDPGDLRTEMHQDAFPGEDISDRPEPSTVVPALLALIVGGGPSGRYALADVDRDGDVADVDRDGDVADVDRDGDASAAAYREAVGR
jgi:NAD(P)-dependent dehydrogenase (short-subunit alcohol dehydrogenase family)